MKNTVFVLHYKGKPIDTKILRELKIKMCQSEFGRMPRKIYFTFSTAAGQRTQFPEFLKKDITIVPYDERKKPYV